MKKVEKSLTTTMEMLNQTRLGRGGGLEVALRGCLRDIPDAEFVTVTVYKFVDDDEEPKTDEPDRS